MIPQPIAEPGIAYLKERGYDIEHGSGSSTACLVRDVVHCDAILVRTAAISKDVLEAGRRLRVIAKHGVGVDHIDVETATAKGIYVTNAPESNANTVSEHTFALIMALSKKLLLADKRCRQGQFELRDRIMGTDLEGKRLGLVGMGRIGALVARKAAAFGMNIVFFDPYLASREHDPAFVRAESLEELLDVSDVVSLHLPLTATTRRLFGHRQLKRMKSTAYLINVSRGEIVQEDALVEALRQGWIAGAALDVFEQEPPDAANPLFAMEQVIVTPHVAALSAEAMERMALHAARGIHEVLSGLPPSWPVNTPVLRSEPRKE